jgi:phosphoenolpyruvate-protein kinase (PTS system EI component)
MTDPLEEKISRHSLKGIAVSPGIAIATVFILQDSLLLVERRNVHQGNVEKEVSRFTRAIRELIDELRNDSFEVSKSARKQEAEIILAHIAILKDPYFVGRIVQDIRKNEVNAESTVVKQVDEFRKVVAAIVDPHLRDYGGDLLDIERRLIEKLIPRLQQLRNLETGTGSHWSRLLWGSHRQKKSASSLACNRDSLGIRFGLAGPL